MPMNRVQFQKGMSLGEFMRRFGTEQACERELEAQRWPQGFECPSCGSREYSNFRRGRLLYYQCCDCRHQASLIAGTVMASSKLGLTLWFQAAYVLSQAKNNVSALELMRHLGVCYQTAWSLKHKLMEAMRERERSRTLSGTVQIDEAFLGGQSSGWEGISGVPVAAAGHGRRRCGVLPEHAGAGLPGGLRWGAELQLREVE
jgi:transposase-like protein